ncbi:hypothetical protein OF83DRAFT_470678 [Amylostereum chailletii]|nr:hypothetical protein OF83DRAFT_470678 [Amylostereum chailletii]
MDSSLFSGTLPPLLTYLYLAFCDIASDCSGFRAPIIFLTLIECGCLPSHVNISELMKILTLVHSTLERFVVHYLDGHLFAHLGAGDMQPIALPHLQYFEIVDVIYMVMNVLSSIIIPPTTELHITAFLPEDADEPAVYIEVLEELLRWLTNHFASTVAAGLCMRRVGIRFEEEDGTTVIGLSEPFEEAPIPGISAQTRPTRVVLTTNCILPTPVPAFNPTPTHHAITVVPQGQGIPLYDGAELLLGANATQSTTDVIVSGLRPIFHGVPLVGTARIVDGEHPMLEYIENWRVISHSCVAVEEIVVRGVSAFGLVAFLAEANVVGAFPMLRSISILGVSFSHQSATGATFSQRFAQSLAAREANSIVLSVQACTVEEDMIVDLRSVAAIADIDWDGLTV